VKPQFLETMIFWRPGNLYCERRRASRAVARSGVILVAGVGMRDRQLTVITSSDTQDDLANVDTGNSSVGLTPSTTHSSLESISTSARQHLVDTDNVVWVSADTEMETFLSGNLGQIPVIIVLASVKCNLFGHVFLAEAFPLVHRGVTHLLAQIRAASKASELNCSYSLETKWMQRGNSSTFARFRPRSKIRIFGSGTPRLNRDLGYGYKDNMSVAGHFKMLRSRQNKIPPLSVVRILFMTMWSSISYLLQNPSSRLE
jgi:hypothetical protein